MITFLLSYYNQGSDILKKHIDLWKSYSTDGSLGKYFKFIIIDDCSLKKPLDLMDFNSLGLDISFYRVLDDLFCNISGVRNLGARICDTEWLLILDMDCLVGVDMAKGLVQIILENNNIIDKTCYKFNRRVKSNKSHPKNGIIHPAVCLIKKSDYWNIGGCEEDLVGNYGYTDPCFWLRAQGKIGVMIRKDLYIDYIEEGEAEINRDNSKNNLIFAKRKKYVGICSMIKKGLIYGGVKDLQKLKGLYGWSDKYIRFRWEKIKNL